MSIKISPCIKKDTHSCYFSFPSIFFNILYIIVLYINKEIYSENIHFGLNLAYIEAGGSNNEI